MGRKNSSCSTTGLLVFSQRATAKTRDLQSYHAGADDWTTGSRFYSRCNNGICFLHNAVAKSDFSSYEAGRYETTSTNFIAALLSGTLRSYETGGCENQHLLLSCPGFTRIAVYQAVYLNKPLCRPANETCDSYSLAPQRAVETCHKKSNCLFLPREMNRCLTYVKLTYKCQPNEFNSRIACEKEKVSLSCLPNQRLAVFRASFGRTQYESMSCPQPQGVPEETCLASYATETFMQICHGKRNCSLIANTETFSKPSCKHQSRLYLNVVYACVPRKVIQLRYVSNLQDDESPDSDQVTTIASVTNITQDMTRAYNTTEMITTLSPESNGGLPTFSYISITTESNFINHTKSKSNYFNFISLYEVHNYLTCNRDKVIFFTALSVAVGVLSCVIFFVCHFLWKKHKKKKDKQEVLVETVTLPNISERINEFYNDVEPDPDITIIDSSISVIPYHIKEDYFHNIPAEVMKHSEEGTKPRSLGLSKYYYS
ncbi:uncharacterized protein LOC142324669 [Lycorma delicatula]|uniref:uncharacterized protein LOC142324669 n=1 Tax=Lycorma delicatula TaxID=130591 RepID=UPI003F50DFFB